MSRRIHKVKTLPSFFAAQRDGLKLFEVRRNDRDYAVGDTFVSREFDPSLGMTIGRWDSGKYFPPSPRGDYTGEELTFRIIYVLPGGRFGIDPDHCVLQLKPVQPEPI